MYNQLVEILKIYGNSARNSLLLRTDPYTKSPLLTAISRKKDNSWFLISEPYNQTT